MYNCVNQFVIECDLVASVVVQDSLQTELQNIMEEETKKENEVSFYMQFDKISSLIFHTFCGTLFEIHAIANTLAVP